MSSLRRFWVFQVQGGESFSMKIPGNPSVHHDGTMTIIQALLTDAQADEFVRVVKTYGCDVPMENSPRETEEDKQEKRDLKDLIKSNSLPSEFCGSCAWLDPSLVGMCGMGMPPECPDSWDEGVKRSSLLKDKYQRDLGKCPWTVS